eukprot:m.493851 g.493851  ORF g.493851 m.493851 type:complete len:459 (-) comp21794_c0_seq31:1848-3224(-)
MANFILGLTEHGDSGAKDHVNNSGASAAIFSQSNVGQEDVISASKISITDIFWGMTSIEDLRQLSETGEWAALRSFGGMVQDYLDASPALYVVLAVMCIGFASSALQRAFARVVYSRRDQRLSSADLQDSKKRIVQVITSNCLVLTTVTADGESTVYNVSLWLSLIFLGSCTASINKICRAQVEQPHFRIRTALSAAATFCLNAAVVKWLLLEAPGHGLWVLCVWGHESLKECCESAVIVALIALQHCADTAPNVEVAGMTVGTLEFEAKLTNDFLRRVVAISHNINLIFRASLMSVIQIFLIYRVRDCIAGLVNIAVAQYNYSRTTNFLSETFPMRAIAKGADTMCAICWEEMSTASTLPCTHQFHQSCLREWLPQQNTCPTCRRTLPTVLGPPLSASDIWHQYFVFTSPFGPDLEGMTQQVSSAFPDVPRAAIRADLMRTGSADETASRILQGLVH